MAFSSAVKEVADDVSKKLKEKDHNETSQYILLYGNYEGILDSLGPQLERFLGTAEYAFGTKLDRHHRSPYVRQYHETFRQITEAWLKGREPVALLVSKNLRLFTTTDPKPETDFQLFAHRCVQHVFDICQHEAKLTDKFFIDGPILAEYSGPEPWTVMANYSEKLEQNRLSHIKTLHTSLTTYLSNGDLHRICDLVNWLETTYMGPVDSEEDRDSAQHVHRFTAQVLLTEYLWPLSDALFIKAARELEFFKPSADDLKIGGLSSEESKQPNALQKVDTNIKVANDPPMPAVPISTAYPTVTTAVSLLVMYNDSVYDRPVSTYQTHLLVG
jgi:hypothetical protein